MGERRAGASPRPKGRGKDMIRASGIKQRPIGDGIEKEPYLIRCSISRKFERYALQECNNIWALSLQRSRFMTSMKKDYERPMLMDVLKGCAFNHDVTRSQVQQTQAERCENLISTPWDFCILILPALRNASTLTRPPSRLARFLSMGTTLKIKAPDFHLVQQVLRHSDRRI